MNNKLQATNTSVNNDFAALFNYPALGRLFDGDSNPAALAAIRTELKNTIQKLERVQRQGSQQDATRAEQILQAYQTTLRFLEELENSNRKA